jgi:hypothetical protein
VVNLSLNDLRIYYSTLDDPDYIECGCSRWDTDNYTTIIETWLTKSQVQTLRNNIVPGATAELYQILGSPHMYDQTWEGHNTIRIVPINTTTGNLYETRNEKVLYVKDISVSPIEGASGWLSVKLECNRSGSSVL